MTILFSLRGFNADSGSGALLQRRKPPRSNRQRQADRQVRSACHEREAAWPSTRLDEASQRRLRAWRAQRRMGYTIRGVERAHHNKRIEEAESDRWRLRELSAGAAR